MALHPVLARYGRKQMWRRWKRIYSRYGYESMWSRFRRIFRRFYGQMRGDQFSLSQSVSELQSLKNSEESLTDIIDTAYRFKGYGKFHTLRPRQVREEINELTKMINCLEPNVILEIGTERGGTLYIWTRLLNEAATIISIDLPEQAESIVPYDAFIETFDNENGRLKLIKGDSRSSKTIAEVNSILDEKTLDFLFIDTEFSYENVRADFENYAPLVRDGGIIAIHDIRHPDGSVDVFWEELVSDDAYDTVEIVYSSDLRDYHLGIGVVKL